MSKSKKKNVKVRDLNPKKDAKGGGGKGNTSANTSVNTSANTGAQSGAQTVTNY